MSANFCLEYFSIVEDEEPKWDEATTKIDLMLKVHLSKWSEVFGGNGSDFTYFFEIYESEVSKYEDEIQPDMNDRIGVCGRLKDHLKKVQQAWDDGTKDSVTITLRGREFLFTGGMSWGDPPTDLYESIGRLLNAGILQAAGFEGY